MSQQPSPGLPGFASDLLVAEAFRFFNSPDLISKARRVFKGDELFTPEELHKAIAGLLLYVQRQVYTRGTL